MSFHIDHSIVHDIAREMVLAAEPGLQLCTKWCGGMNRSGKAAEKERENKRRGKGISKEAKRKG